MLRQKSLSQIAKYLLQVFKKAQVKVPSFIHHPVNLSEYQNDVEEAMEH